MSIDSSNLSYWEYKSWFSNVDFTIVGSGIVGLSTAINLKKRYPSSKFSFLNADGYQTEPAQKMPVLLVLVVFPKSLQI